MGQLFNRLKRLARAQIGAIKDKILGNNFLRDKWEASDRVRDNIGSKFEGEQERFKDIWNDLTSGVPLSLSKSYLTIGVPFGASLDVARRAWKEKLKKHHPDLFTDPKEREAATRKASEINEAFQKIEKYFTKGII